MKCFYLFKEKSRKKEERSKPVSSNEGSRAKSLNSSARKTTTMTSKSSNSGVSAVSSPRSIPDLYQERAQNLRVFTFPELRAATNDFSRMLKIGEGGFGSVYKGFIKLPDDSAGGRTVVAVKKLNQNGLQGHKQWMAEVQFLGVVDHPNLVKLVGYCAVDGERGIQRLLVYEFMPNRSLEDHLFSKTLPALPWHTRLQITLGAAQGLTYLHEELEVQVIYRDFKTSNVLLDEDFKPKLSDFGLAREGPSAGHTHVSTAVVGTYGYAAPDYIQTGHLTSKSDVWSFGVVLYEILTGRRIMDRNRPTNEQKLLEWVKQYPPDGKKFFMIMDPRLEREYSLSAARSIAKLADICLSKYSKDRPKMSEVVESLKQAIQMSETGNDPETNIGSSEIDLETDTKPSDQVDASDYSRRQFARLARLREHVHGVGRGRFATMRKAAVS